MWFAQVKPSPDAPFPFPENHAVDHDPLRSEYSVSQTFREVGCGSVMSDEYGWEVITPIKFSTPADTKSRVMVACVFQPVASQQVICTCERFALARVGC